MIELFAKGKSLISDFLFPPFCLHCKERSASKNLFCDPCMEEIFFTIDACKEKKELYVQSLFSLCGIGRTLHRHMLHYHLQDLIASFATLSLGEIDPWPSQIVYEKKSFFFHHPQNLQVKKIAKMMHCPLLKKAKIPGTVLHLYPELSTEKMEKILPQKDHVHFILFLEERENFT